jgi:hypothetical protein
MNTLEGKKGLIVGVANVGVSLTVALAISAPPALMSPSHI